MKIGEQVRELTVVGDPGETRKATISADKMAKLQYLLTKGLYRDPITAVIAEWTNNGIDSVVQAGKDPVENPVIVTIGISGRGQNVFSVEDKGTGLDDKEFENICMNYLESTKENDDNAIGHFGLGLKSFLALERSATFTCRKKGIERVYLVYEGEEFVNYELINEKETEEENGVKAELVINGYMERQQFVSKAKQKLAYYETAVLVIDGKPEVWDIQRNELFQRSTANLQMQMHLCLKDVYYAIDWEALGIAPINYPIALRFSLTDGITPTPSRESYITNEKTKKLIMDRIGKVANWMVTKYNDTVKEFDTFKDAFPYLGVGHPTLYIATPDNNRVEGFPLNIISHHSNIYILQPKVKGITLRNPEFYKRHREDLFFEFIPVGYTNRSGIYRNWKNGGWTALSCANVVFQQKGAPIIVNDGMKGNVREFLKMKYGKDQLFVRVNPEERKLTGDKKVDYTSYVSILDLHLKPKKLWRPLINEWKFVRDQVFKEMKDERMVESTKEYQDWLEKKKSDLRSKKKPTVYKGLNKKAGDVTLSQIYTHKRGVGWQKYVHPIAKLTEKRYLTVLLDDNDKDKELAKKLYRMMGNDKVIFAVVGKKEKLKIPKHFQFINFERFMTRDCKPFMRLASAIAFDKALKDFKKISRFQEGIFQNCLSGLINDSDRLAEYVYKNLKDIDDEEVEKYILQVADQHKLYDYELWDVYTRLKEGTKKYDFIACLIEPRVWDEEERKKYTRTINQMLLFRKLYYNDLPEDAYIAFGKKEDVKI